jgi:hypothetical protein
MQGAVFLQLYEGSAIDFGSASTGSGGGVYCELGGTIIVADGSRLTNNLSWLNGGGIFAYDCFVSIEASGPPDASVGASNGVTANIALQNGGGIYAAGGSTVQLIGRSPSELAHVTYNESRNFGGGLFLVDSGTSAVARNAVINKNFADSGGGVWVGIGGSSFTMDVDPLTCSGGRNCSILAENYASAGNSGAILVAGGSSATLRQTRISGNYALGGAQGSVSIVNGTLLIEGSEIFDNTSALDTEVSRFYVPPSGSLTVAFSTLVEDTVSPTAGLFWVWSGSTFRLLSSIVQADHTFRAPGVASGIDCVITRELASFPAGGTFLTTVVDPTFLFANPAANDFRLKRGSEARDYCDNFHYTPVDDDIDNHPHGHEDTGVVNFIGPYDLGADEWQPDIFADGFESATTIRWSGAVP